jgi:Recombination endonuclease VII
MSDPTYMQNFLHPPKKPPKPMMKVFPDGREILDLKTTAGATEYQRRKLEMWERQGKRCALQITDICKQRQGRWPKDETQFDHEHGRGGGKQDDRILVNGVPQNAAVCGWCNSAKGSRKMAYNLAFVP